MNAADIDLSKWPRLLCAGDPVTLEQAEDIILRTTWWSWLATNDRRWLAEISAIMTDVAKKPQAPRDIDHTLGRVSSDAVEHDRARWMTEMHAYSPALAAWCKHMGILDLAYLSNEIVASAWIGGPHGWVSLDGTIGCSTWNIGKWPTVDEVESDLRQIAAAFPYLVATFQLVPNEGEASGPVVEWCVKDGSISACYDSARLTPVTSVRALSVATVHNRLAGLRSERGVTSEWLLNAVSRWVERRSAA